MDWSELKPLLDRLEDTATPRGVISIISKAKKDMHFIGGFATFIRTIIAKDMGVGVTLNVVPPKKRILVDDFLDMAYEYWQKGAFNHRKDPGLFEAYCHPMSDKRGKYLDEMTESQRHVFSMMNEDIIAAKKIERMAEQPNQSTIEGALDDAIRKKVRETSKDTPE